MSISAKNSKKIGLVASISILIGSVVGIGIFFKNNTVFKNNNDNAIGVLISWILAAIIAFCAAFSFAEIGFGKRNGAGLAGSVEHMYGHKTGRFINFNQNFFYTGILNISIAIFTAEAFVNIFIKNPNNFHIGFIFLIALGFLVIFLMFNYFSMKWSTRSQIVTTILKFLPLLIVAFTGIIYGAMHPENSLFVTNQNNGGVAKNLSIQGILSSLPAILFAFDSFLSFGNIKHEMKDPYKQVSLTVVIGMIICVILYLTITIGQIMVSSGTAGGVFDTVFENQPNVKKGLNIFINIFIFISIIGVLNALILTGLRSYEQFITNRIAFGYWSIQALPNNKCINGLIGSALIYGFWFIIISIPSIICNTDAFVDGISNFPTLFMFAVYGSVILKGIINRATKKVEPAKKMKGFLVFAPIAVIGCYLAFGYQFFYGFSIDAFIDPYGIINWGLFFDHGYMTHKYVACIWFFVSIFTFILAPIINDLLLKYKYNKILKGLNFSPYVEKLKSLKKELLI